MTTTRPDSAAVVVIGGGLEDCATAWALTRRGITDVTIAERDTVVELRRRHPGEDLRLSRFAEGALLTSPHPYIGAGQMR